MVQSWFTIIHYLSCACSNIDMHYLANMVIEDGWDTCHGNFDYDHIEWQWNTYHL